MEPRQTGRVARWDTHRGESTQQAPRGWGNAALQTGSRLTVFPRLWGWIRGSSVHVMVGARDMQLGLSSRLGISMIEGWQLRGSLHSSGRRRPRLTPIPRFGASGPSWLNWAGLTRFLTPRRFFSEGLVLYFGGFTTVEVVGYLYFTPAE